MASSIPDPVGSLTELRALSKVIQESIDSIERSLVSKNQEFPSSLTPFTKESEAPRMIPEVSKACSLIVAAAYQLVYTARSPMLSVSAVASQHAISAALGAASSANVVEALREAGPKGAHVNDIAKASSVDPSKLARILRLLATNHIFVEVAPDVFANNRVSSCMDTGKSVKTLLDNPGTRHIGTSGIPATVEIGADSHFKVAAYLSEWLLDPKTAHSEAQNETAFNLAFKTDLPAWKVLAQDEYRRMRFQIAMEGAKQASDPKSILEGFDWNGLKQDALVVDVGGGMGAQSLTLAQNCPQLRFVVQDHATVVKDAVGFWNGHMPGALDSGRVQLQAHDFFTPQPVKDASVFLLRNIIHDWPDKPCLQILQQLRAAAAPDTRLVIVDTLIAYACDSDDLQHIPGAARPTPPKPLLPNMGHAATLSYQIDMQILWMLNGKERTLKQMQELLDQTGWRIVQVVYAVAFSASKVIAVPA